VPVVVSVSGVVPWHAVVVVVVVVAVDVDAAEQHSSNVQLPATPLQVIFA